MKAVRKVVFWVHLSMGCAAGLVILTMSVTGILLAFERQINVMADAPAVLQGQTSTAGQAGVDALLDKLMSGGQGAPTQLVLHSDPKMAVEARYGREKTLLLNPWTGEVIGQPNESTREFFGEVERVHRSVGLGMRSSIGRGFTGAANLMFLFMLVSGVYLWIPKVWSAASIQARALFRGGVSGRAREWNWHHVIGIWAAFPLLFIVGSGVVMSYPWANNLLYSLTGSQPPAGRDSRAERPTQQPRVADQGRDATAPVALHSLDEMVGVVKQREPLWKSITLEVPREKVPTLTLSVDTSIGGQPEKARQLVMNRETGRVAAQRQFTDNVLGRRLRAYARFVHTGEEFGVAGEAIAAMASLGAVLLVWTGISLALRRLFTMANGSEVRAEPVVTADAEFSGETVNS